MRMNTMILTPLHIPFLFPFLHVDQNEKLVKYGVTHEIARDGFSGKIVSYLTLPIKNNLAIYEHIYRYIHVVIV